MKSAATAASILVVDDDEVVQELLHFELIQDGHNVSLCGDGQEAVDLLASGHFDLVVLDIMLPSLDGIEVLRRIREHSDVPVIMLTAKSDEFDRVLGLEIGADDYVTKDVLSVREFRSRVRAQLRRAAIGKRARMHNGSVRCIAELEIDLARRSVRRGDHLIRLTFVEFEILKTLALHAGTVYTRPMLLQVLWGSPDYRDDRTIDTHIRHLREKLERDPSNPEYIFTVRSVGYTFREA